MKLKFIGFQNKKNITIFNLNKKDKEEEKIDVSSPEVLEGLDDLV